MESGVLSEGIHLIQVDLLDGARPSGMAPNFIQVPLASLERILATVDYLATVNCESDMKISQCV